MAQFIKGLETPKEYFEYTWKSFARGVIALPILIYVSGKWLFVNVPHITWMTIVFTIIIASISKIYREVARADKAEKEYLTLRDSLSQVNMEHITYTTLSGKTTSPITPYQQKKAEKEAVK